MFARNETKNLPANFLRVISISAIDNTAELINYILNCNKNCLQLKKNVVRQESRQNKSQQAIVRLVKFSRKKIQTLKRTRSVWESKPRQERAKVTALPPGQVKNDNTATSISIINCCLRGKSLVPNYKTLALASVNTL